jgi:YbbR domain-containing protein
MDNITNKDWFWWIISFLIVVFMIIAINTLKEPYYGDPNKSSTEEQFPRW